MDSQLLLRLFFSGQVADLLSQVGVQPITLKELAFINVTLTTVQEMLFVHLIYQCALK